MERTQTCCFEYDRKRGPGGKRLFLRTFCFYFMVAGFTYLSPLPEVDKLLPKYHKQLESVALFLSLMCQAAKNQCAPSICDGK